VILPLDLRTLTLALRIARRLTVSSNSAEGLSLLRELLASLVNSNQILAVIQAWIGSGSRALPPDNITMYCKKLPIIIETFAASGHAIEAVRVMATGVGLDPAMGSQLVEAARYAFTDSITKTISEECFAASRELTSIGMGILEAGNPEGIILMGAAHSVAPQYEMPVEEIEANLDHLQARQPASLGLREGQTLTKAAYDLHFSGRQEPAVRVGTLVPAMLSGASADQLFTRLEGAARPGTEKAFHTSRQILGKGYAAQAANLLVDSGSVSADDMWASLDREIGDPSQDLKTPSRVNYWARSIRSRLADPAQVDPPGPAFFFTLEGEEARCDEVLWGKVFELVFHYDVLPADTLAGVKGEQLKPLLRNTKAELGIDVVPKGLTLTDGAASRVVRFEDGKMVGDPPHFGLKAPAKDADTEPEPRGVYITFTISGASIYAFFLAIRLVDRFATGPCATQILNLDLEEVAAITVEPRLARLYLTSQGDNWLIWWDIDGVQSVPRPTSAISAAKLQAAYDSGGIICPASAPMRQKGRVEEGRISGPS